LDAPWRGHGVKTAREPLRLWGVSGDGLPAIATGQRGRHDDDEDGVEGVLDSALDPGGGERGQEGLEFLEQGGYAFTNPILSMRP
jgi:hypothetical protein